MAKDISFEENYLSFKSYDDFTGLTDSGPSPNSKIEPPWLFYLLGLNGEVGELTEKVKKLFRDKDGVIDSDFRILIMKEVGDIIWYLSRLSYYLGFSLAEAAIMNICKLTDRIKRDKIHGEGDDR